MTFADFTTYASPPGDFPWCSVIDSGLADPGESALAPPAEGEAVMSDADAIRIINDHLLPDFDPGLWGLREIRAHDTD